MAESLVELAGRINGMSEEERAVLLEMIAHDNTKGGIETFLYSERAAEEIVCPVCGNKHIVKNGKRSDGVQKYKCKEGHHHFVMTTNSILFGTRKDLSTWIKFIDCTLNNEALEESAQKCGIHKNTALAWRHKLFEAVGNISMDKMSGEIEMDETYQDISYKGNHTKNQEFTMPRKAHKRGSDSTTRGLSNDKVCIPCAVTKGGQADGKIVKCGTVSYQGLSALFTTEKIEEKSTFITDECKSYIGLARDLNANLVQIPSGSHTLAGYDIQRVNSFHSEIKRLINYVYRGVSTKHLNGYIAWASFRFKKSKTMQRISLMQLLTAEFFDTIRNILLFPPVPVLTNN